MFERVNPVTEGINAYKAVNDIFRGNREEQRAIAETEYNRNRQARLDEMSAESHKAALESNALAQETSRLQLEKARKADEIAKAKELELTIRKNPQGWFNDLGLSDQEEVIAATKGNPKFAFLHTPEMRRQQLAKIQQIYAAMPNPNKPQFDMPSLLDGLNHVFASQLDKGTDDRGEPAKKEIASFTMDPRDKSFIPELKVTRKDGSSYFVPMTVDPVTGERSSSPDSIVKKITIPQIADYLGTAEGLINLFEAKRVGLGDDEPLKAALAEIKGKKESKQLAGAVTAIDKAWDPAKSAKENTLTGLAAALETAPDSASAIKALEVVLKAKEEKETKLDWQDNVMGKDGKVYKVAYDSKGKAVKRERQYVKPEKETKDPLATLDLRDAQSRRREALARYNKVRAAVGTESDNGFGTVKKITTGDIRVLKDELAKADEDVRMVGGKGISLPTSQRITLSANAKELRQRYERTDDRLYFEKSARKRGYSEDTIKYMKGELDDKDVDLEFGGQAVSGATSINAKPGAVRKLDESKETKIEVKQSFNGGDVILATDGTYYKKTKNGYVKANVKQRGA